MNSMYFVAVVLPPELNEKILAYKKWMAEDYGCAVGLKSPAHITLLPPFWTPVENEDMLKNDLNSVAASVASFRLTTDNFSAFKPRTLFVAVKASDALNELKKAVDRCFTGRNYGTKTETRTFHPHITLATRDLHKSGFADAWTKLEHKTFDEQFDVTGLSLLRHNGRTWDVIYTAAFPN